MKIVISRDVFFVKESNQVCSNQWKRMLLSEEIAIYKHSHWHVRLNNLSKQPFCLVSVLLKALPCKVCFFLVFICKAFKFGSSNGRSFLCIAFIYWHAISKRCDCNTWNFFFRSSVKFLVVNLKYESSNEYFFISS